MSKLRRQYVTHSKASAGQESSRERMQLKPERSGFNCYGNLMKMGT